MKTAYTTHRLLFESRDVAIIVSNSAGYRSPLNVFDDDTVIQGEIYISPDFNKHNEIECNIILNNSNICLETMKDNSSVFFVCVTMSNGEDPICEIKDRNFKLEHLSMELQERIHKTANEMYIDWLKVKED